MKCKIYISGQIGGNFRIARKLHNYKSNKNGMFNSFYFYYNTVKEAKEDIKQAFRQLKYDELDFYKNGGMSKSSDNTKINYDASSAIILKN